MRQDFEDFEIKAELAQDLEESLMMENEMTQKQDLEALEGMVDRHGLSGVLSMLSEICGAKAAHIASNWQDKNLAKVWDKAGDVMSALAAKIKN